MLRSTFNRHGLCPGDDDSHPLPDAFSKYSIREYGMDPTESWQAGKEATKTESCPVNWAAHPPAFTNTKAPEVDKYNA